MNKAVMISIQPYYVFLIIARIMGWDIPQEKTVEVRKDYPKDRAWNKKAYIYCSKSKRSFNRIPAQYQPFMAKFLGKVIGEFLCDRIDDFRFVPDSFSACPAGTFEEYVCKASCLSFDEINAYMIDRCITDNGSKIYINNKTLYGWHISDLKIYDEPKELSEFIKPCPFNEECDLTCPYALGEYHGDGICGDMEFIGCENTLTRPPQSWCYVEGIEDE